MNLCSKVLSVLQGKTLVTAESCTGGGIGSDITAVPGSSAVYKGGIVCYSNWVKEHILGVPGDLLERYGAVSAPVAEAMAKGVRSLLQADVAVSVTGLAGPGGDEYGHAVGTVFIGCDTDSGTVVKEYHFAGDRDQVRSQAIEASFRVIISCIEHIKNVE